MGQDYYQVIKHDRGFAVAGTPDEAIILVEQSTDPGFKTFAYERSRDFYEAHDPDCTIEFATEEQVEEFARLSRTYDASIRQWEQSGGSLD